MERREVPYVRPAGRQANATQEAFARARSVWPRRGPTTGPNRGRTSPAEMTRGHPKPTCAGPPGRARACRVLCGPSWSLSLLSSFLSRPCLTASPLVRMFATPLDALSLPETATCAPLSLSLPRRFFLVAPIALASSTPSLTLCYPGCEDEVVPRKRSGRC